MLLLRALAVGVVVYVIYLSYARLPSTFSTQTPQPGSQFEVFRDMEPADQTRENPWMGYLQEDVRANRAGPIGNFMGTPASSGDAHMYYLG